MFYVKYLFPNQILNNLTKYYYIIHQHRVKLHWQQHGGQNIDLWKINFPPCLVCLQPSFFPAITRIRKVRRHFALAESTISQRSLSRLPQFWFKWQLCVHSGAGYISVTPTLSSYYFNWREQVVPWKEYMLLNRWCLLLSE